jgi:hypothetical protein
MRGEHHHEFWFAYLVAWYGVLAIGLGGLFFVILQHLVRAGWSIAVRRLAENAMITLPILCLVGRADRAVRHARPLPLDRHRRGRRRLDAVEQGSYLNEGFFKIRIGVYFAVWTLLSVLFYRWSTTGDGDAESAPPATPTAPAASRPRRCSCSPCR